MDNNPAPIGRILIKFDIWGFFENLSRDFKFLLKSDTNNLYFTRSDKGKVFPLQARCDPEGG